MIITLCGSTKYKKEFEYANMKLTLDNHIVLAPGVYTHADNIIIDDETKINLDSLHKRKIELADKVIIICPYDYIGSSTSSEILYAKSLNKPIEYWPELRP